MKRFIIIFLTLVLVPLSGVFPVSARNVHRFFIADLDSLVTSASDSLEGQFMTREEAEARKLKYEQAVQDSIARKQAYNDSLLAVKAAKDSIKFVQDSLKHVEDSIRKSFSGLNYSMQKRFRPQNEVFKAETFMDNTFIMANIGTGILFPQSKKNVHLGLGPDFKVFAGKWIDPYNSVRVGLSGGFLYRTYDNNRINRFSFEAMHMFNLISYINGYKKDRLCEVATVEGLSYNLSWINRKVNNSLGLHLGFDVSLRLSKDVDFFIEPIFSFYTDNIDFSGKNNWRGYDAGFSPTLGIVYNWPDTQFRRHRQEKKRKPLESFFFSLTEGIQFQNSSLVKETMGIGKSLGGHFDFSMGKWFTSYFALNAGLFYSFHKWVMYPDNVKFPSRYLGLRIEAMFDLIDIFSRGRIKNFAFPVFVGPELGLMHKIDMAKSVKQGYFGVTYGIQPEYRFYKQFSVFFEPRMSVVPYTVSEYESYPMLETRNTYYDYIFNFNIGLRFTL